MALRPLNERERRFVDAYMGAAAGNGTQAAITAGYARNSAKVTASRLLTKANVSDAIQIIRLATEKTTIADAKERRETLTTIVRSTREQSLVRVKAVDVLNKMDGVYVQKHWHSGPNGDPIRTKSDDDINARLGELERLVATS